MADRQAPSAAKPDTTPTRLPLTEVGAALVERGVGAGVAGHRRLREEQVRSVCCAWEVVRGW